MNFLRKLFGKRPAPPENAAPSPQDGDQIRVFDSYGRECFVARKVWMDSILPNTVKEAWEDPERLYNIVTCAFYDGFRPQITKAAKHLYDTNPRDARFACLWGVVLMEEGKLDKAVKVFRAHMAIAGEDGYVLANLAKALHSRGDTAASESTLWHSLEVDPNQENGLAWYVAIQKERSGDAAAKQALRRVAALPGSWGAQLWLARDALAAGDLRHARTLYEVALTAAGTPPPAPLLMQMSGDLGNHGHHRTVIELAEPLFNPPAHGLPVGNNLIQAHIHLKDFDRAAQILNKLYALKRPDWAQSLSSLDSQIAAARIAAQPAADESPEISMGTIDGPIWLPPSCFESDLFPKKPSDEFLICFLGSTAAQASVTDEVVRQMADTPGRLSRAVPLFLAEQAYFCTKARTRILMPTVANDAAFVLSGRAWTDQEGAEYGRQSDGRHIVLSHIRADTDPWSIELRLIRARDGACLASLEAPCPTDQDFHDEIPDLARRLVQSLQKHADVQPQKPPAPYAVPSPPAFSMYLLRLEQLLAARNAASKNAGPDFLNGVRDIVSGNIDLCLDCPTNPTTRLVLARTVRALKQTHPNVFKEFTEKLARLQGEHPLPAPVHAIVKRMLDEDV